MNHKILRLPEVKTITGISRSNIYLKMAEGTFPKPIKLGGQRAIGWLEHEIDEWVAKQIQQSRSKLKPDQKQINRLLNK